MVATMAMRPCLISAFWNHFNASGEASSRILAPRGGHLLPVSTDTPKASLMDEAEREDVEVEEVVDGANAEAELSKRARMVAVFMVV